jgi:hypothetical protein
MKFTKKHAFELLCLAAMAAVSSSSDAKKPAPPWREADFILDSDEERAEHNRLCELARERKKNNGMPKFHIHKPDRSEPSEPQAQPKKRPIRLADTTSPAETKKSKTNVAICKARPPMTLFMLEQKI